MKSAFNKDVIREIINTIGRFLGIFAIIALGVAFFTGLGATGIDMKLTADVYLDEQKLSDIRVLSNYGLNKNDIEAIRQVPGVKNVVPSYNMDVFIEGKDATLIAKVYAFDMDAPEEEQVNVPRLLSGRMPAKGNEVLVEARALSLLKLEIGDSITLNRGKESDIRYSLKTNQYKIVGVIRSPYYISTERGSSSIGNGIMNCYIMVPEENFMQNVYSEAYVIVEGGEQLLCFHDDYQNLVDEIADKIEAVSDVRIEQRSVEMKSKAYAALHKSEEEINKQEKELRKSFALRENNLFMSKKELAESERGLSSNLNEIDNRLNVLAETENALHSAKSEAAGGVAALEAQRDELNTVLVGVDESIYGAEAVETRITLNSSIALLEASLSEVEQQGQQLDGTIREMKALRDELEQARNELIASNKAIAENKKGLADAEKALADGKATAFAELDIGKVQIAETKKTLDDMVDVKWYVLDRNSAPGYAGFSDDADKMQAIGRVFPLIFFIVAALVSLTTMTRLVEERRTEIGTLKSLGYNELKIMSKYIVYAITPTLLGGIVGGAFGMKFFPGFVIAAYSGLYAIPSPILKYDIGYWVIGTLIAAGCTVLATLFSCVNELKESPSNLMRPKPPKAGKRTFMERIKFVWSSLSFSYKVTIRNIFRYKKRFYMTVIGISGCTSLLVTGFGLKDSVSEVMPLQYGQICKYDMPVVFSEDANSKEISRVNKILLSSKVIGRTLQLREKSMDAETVPGNSQTVFLMVPEEASEMTQFITLRDRMSREPVELGENGAVINEKLAKLLGAGVGDTITLKEGDDKRVEVVVSGITENYVMNYVYLSSAYYKQIYKENVEFNTIYSIFSETAAKEDIDALANEILEKKGVSAVNFVSTATQTFSTTIATLNMVVVLLIVSAGALAFVVLLNLTSININERIRELATIEVLGFYDKEVQDYVYRENIILSIIGTLAGLVLGMALHGYIMQTVETTVVMFSIYIAPASFVYSIILTMLFSVSVNFLTSGKLKKINMVEALKSIE